jgi:hypothetical protein
MYTKMSKGFAEQILFWKQDLLLLYSGHSKGHTGLVATQ